MKENRRLLDETIRMKRLMSIKDVIILSEQTTASQDKVKGYVDAFYRAYAGWGTNTTGIMAVLNQIPDKNTFIEFYYSLRNLKKRSFEEIINDEFEEDDSVDAVKIQQLLKSKFNIDSNPGLGGSPSLPPRQRIFKKSFKITSLNNTDPNKKDGLTAYMDTVGEPIKNPTQTPEKQVSTTTSPQTYNDVLNGKGVLKTGITSPAVGELQQKLLDLGYTAIAKPTNYFGTQTLNAVKDFQEKNSLTVDGKVGGNTSKKIDQILDIRKRRTSSQGQIVPNVPTKKLDTSISGLPKMTPDF